MKCPQKYVALLGQMFDWELAQLAGVSPTQARQWRLDAGISPQCKGCRAKAPSKCPQHSEHPPFVPAEQIDVDAAMRELAALDRKHDEARKRVDDLIQQLRRTYEIR
jgi:hypothetical protein